MAIHMQIFALSLFNDIEISGPISLYLLCIDAAFNASNAPVIVKPQGGGAGHTPGDLTFYHFFMSNSLPREQQVVSNIPSLGGNCNN